MNGPIRADRGEVIRIFSFQTLATCCATLTTPTARSGWGVMAQPETSDRAARPQKHDRRCGSSLLTCSWV